MVSVRYCGRDFTPQDLDGIRAIIASPERPHRTAIAQAVCRLFNWVKPDGGLKVVSCSVALKRMQADGLIEPGSRNDRKSGVRWCPWEAGGRRGTAK